MVFQNAGIAAGSVLIASSLALNTKRKADFIPFLIFLISGILLDSVLSMTGIFEFPGNQLIPLWLLTLWTAFALVMPRGFGFLYSLPVILQSLIGSFAGIIAYAAGHALAAVDYPHGLVISLLVIGACWSLYLPLMLFITAHFRLKTV